MKVLIQGYNICRQNKAGGVSTRIKSFKEALERNGVECKIFDYWNDKIEDYDIVHFFKLCMDHVYMVSYVSKKKIPMILSTICPLDGSFKVKTGRFLAKIGISNIYSINENTLKKFSLLLTESNKEKMMLSKNYNISNSKLIALPNGINIPLYPTKLIFKSKFKIERDYVLCVGSFDHNKNQLNLIRAMKDTGIQLVFVGGAYPGFESYFEQCKKEGGSAIFTGWLKHEDPLLLSAYKEAKVCVCPSHKETFGYVILEGALSGNNIAYNKDLPISEYGIEKYSKTFDSNNLDSIRNAVLSAYSDPTSDYLRQFVIDNFSWDNIARKHIELYNTILK